MFFEIFKKITSIINVEAIKIPKQFIFFFEKVVMTINPLSLEKHNCFNITYTKGTMKPPVKPDGHSPLPYYSGTLEISRLHLNGGTYTHKCSHIEMIVSFERSVIGVEIESPL